MKDKPLKEQIKSYWEERAGYYMADPASTTNDVYLRELEVLTITKVLKALLGSGPGSVLDVGCGEGYSTLKVAQELRALSIRGVDYSANMINMARERLAAFPVLNARLQFAVGDVLDLTSVDDSLYDAVISDRCLINLESKADQRSAMREIALHVRPQGYYLAVENFSEGQEAMNRAREVYGLPPIPVRWHNLYFSEKEFLDFATPYFEFMEFKNFASTYYLTTRVLYSALCRQTGADIDYRNPIHQLSVDLPWTGNFSPIRMAVLQRKAA